MSPIHPPRRFRCDPRRLRLPSCSHLPRPATKVQFTASAEFRDKIERLTALMRASVPDGDLAVILEQAVTEKLERLEAKRFAETRTPRKTLEEADTSPSGRYIAAPVKRIVRRRDGDQGTFVDENARRCTERRGLEFHHRNPYGLGGDRSPENICLMCHAHNAYLAELDYGKEVMERYRRRDGRVSETGPGYFAGFMLPSVGFFETARTRDA